MVFAPDTEDSLVSAVALVNTADPETMTDVDALDAFCTRWRWTGSRAHDDAELTAVRRLRPRLRAVWASDLDGAVRIVNDLLARAHALPQLVTHDEWGYHLHATTPEAPLATRMAVEAAMALVDVIRSGELGRLFRCAAPGCPNVGVDLSRNRSKRYCGPACGNRCAAADYRARAARAAG